MKPLFWFLGLVAGALALMTLAGLFLPRDHVAAVSLRLDAGPAAVFATLSNFEGAPGWRHDVERVERLAPLDGKPSWREYTAHGPVTYVLEMFAPGSRMVVAIDDDDLPYGGRWVYVLEPDGGGTQLTITEEGFVKNPLFRFLSHIVFGQTATLEAYLADLAAHFGEAAAPRVVLGSPAGV